MCRISLLLNGELCASGAASVVDALALHNLVHRRYGLAIRFPASWTTRSNVGFEALGHRHHFPAPAVNPFTMCRCAKISNSSAGITDSTAPAAITPFLI